MTVAIRTEGLSKRYRLDRAAWPWTLKSAITERAAGRLRSDPAPEGRDSWFWALRDVSLEVPRGEVLGIVGRNGAGKSTLLRILTRISRPTSGWAEIHGRAGALIGVGTGFHPELSGRENVYLNAAILGMKRAEIARRFDEIVAFAEVESFIDVPVKRYSSGMQARLSFAVAAHMEADILLVDEVLAVGDAAFQRKCLGTMEGVARAGRTVLFVSHNVTAIQKLCHRVIWLDEGRIAEEGDPRDVVGKYLQKLLVPLTEQVWDEPGAAPGTDRFRLRRASVRPAGGTAGDAIGLDTPFTIEFEYWNLHPGARLHVSFHLLNQYGVVVFRAAPFGAGERREEELPAGLVRETCLVPGNLLNDGVHRVELAMGHDHQAPELRKDDVLVFEVVDTASPGTGIRWHGAVRPALAWSTQILEDEMAEDACS